MLCLHSFPSALWRASCRFLTYFCLPQNHYKVCVTNVISKAVVLRAHFCNLLSLSLPLCPTLTSVSAHSKHSLPSAAHQHSFNIAKHCYFLFSFTSVDSTLPCPLITILLLHIFISHILIYILPACHKIQSCSNSPIPTSESVPGGPLDL